jgi:hypothetical protein
MATTTESRSWSRGLSYTGKAATTQWQLNNTDGSVNTAYSNTGVHEVDAPSGHYNTLITRDVTFVGTIIWKETVSGLKSTVDDIQAVTTVTQSVILPAVSEGCAINPVQDSRDTWTIYVLDSSGVALNLAPFTSVKISMWNSSKIMKITLATAVISNATLGIVTYDPTANDMDTADSFTAQLTFTDSGGKSHVYPSFPVRISARVK